MRRLLWAFAALVAATCTMAQDNFPDVPPPPPWISDLGYLIGGDFLNLPFQRSGPGHSRTAVARALVEFTDELTRVDQSINQTLPTLQSPSAAREYSLKLTKLQHASARVPRVANGLAAELVQLGTTTARLVASSHHALKHFGAAITYINDRLEFSDADRERVASIVDELKRAGLLVGYPHGLVYRSRPTLRYEYAVAAHATSMHLVGLAKGILQESLLTPGATGFDTDMENWRLHLPRWVDLVQQLADEFSWELRSMGANVEEVHVRLREAQQNLSIAATKVEAAHAAPFRDIPANHWASKAAKELKAAGLLAGYPDGRFRG